MHASPSLPSVSVLPAREQRLARLTVDLAGYPAERVELLAGRLLGLAGDDVPPERLTSRLNNDGSPLQLCITSSPAGEKYRLLGDPGCAVREIEARHQRSLDTLAGFIDEQAPGLESQIEETLDAHLPADLTANAVFAGGTLWIGLPLESRGLALYVKGAWGTPPAQMERVRRWLRRLGTPDTGVRGLLEAIERHGGLASAGLEGASPETCRLKIYARLRDARPLRSLGIDLFRAEPFARFLAAALGDEPLPATGLVLSVGLDPASGAALDAKIDLCGHCLDCWVSDWAGHLEAIARAVDLPPVQAARLDLGKRADVAFIGFGLHADGSARLNTYLKSHDDA